MSRLFPKPMKEEGQPDEVNSARQVSGSCQPWCRWSDDRPSFPHPPACESLSFTSIFAVKGRDARRKRRKIEVTLAERHLHGLHPKKVLNECDPTWVHLETGYVVDRAEKAFDIYLPPGEAFRLAAALHAAALAAEGLDEPITKRVRDWRAWTRGVDRELGEASSASDKISGLAS